MVKALIEIPDPVFRLAKSAAAEQGISLNELVNAGILLKLKGSSKDKPWMASFGRMRHLRAETDRINHILAEEFSRIEQGDRF
jgi:hypothetical protein